MSKMAWAAACFLFPRHLLINLLACIRASALWLSIISSHDTWGVILQLCFDPTGLIGDDRWQLHPQTNWGCVCGVFVVRMWCVCGAYVTHSVYYLSVSITQVGYTYSPLVRGRVVCYQGQEDLHCHLCYLRRRRIKGMLWLILLERQLERALQNLNLWQFVENWIIWEAKLCDEMVCSDSQVCQHPGPAPHTGSLAHPARLLGPVQKEGSSSRLF